MVTSQNPTEKQDMGMEEERMKSLKCLVDQCAQTLSEQNLSLKQAKTWIEKTRKKMLELFPGKEEQFELIYRPRFERIIQERALNKSRSASQHPDTVCKQI